MYSIVFDTVVHVRVCWRGIGQGGRAGKGWKLKLTVAKIIANGAETFLTAELCSAENL